MPLADRFENRMRRVNRALERDGAFVGKIEAVTALARRMVPGCDGAGIALQIRNQTRSVTVTDPLVLEVDLVQYDSGQGPCLSAIDRSRVVHIDVLEIGEPWEHFAPGALDRGVHSVLSMPIVARDRTVGALNLYGRTEGAFGAEAKRLAAPLAVYAGEVIAVSELYRQSSELFAEVLDEMAAKSAIDTAVGVIMGRHSIGPDAARRALEAVAERRGSSLWDAAEWELREEQFRMDPESAAPDEE